MDCRQAQMLLAPHILGDLDNDPQRCKGLHAHLLCCTDCAETYQSFQEVIRFVWNHKAEFAQAFKNVRDRERKGIVLARSISNEPAASIKESSRDYKSKITVEENWKDLCKCCPELAENTEKPKSLQLFLHVGAIAACLVMGVLTWMVFKNHSKQQALSQNIVSPQVVTTPKPSMKVELVKPTGNIAINTDQAIVADKEIKLLLINGKHHIVMNTNTVFTIEPTINQSNIGCLVKLDSGQIYIHVQHDGNPFIVDTTNGRAVITGTTFDIKATKDSTTLVVTEGTVSFESEKGTVNVAANQISKIIANSAPTRPVPCNTTKLTAWATRHKFENSLAGIGPITETYDTTDLPLFVTPEPVELESINYDQWIEEKREWFKGQFPWIFELQNALAKEEIEIDYPQLIIQSGDIWQFVCLETVPVRFSAPIFDSLIKTAVSYGFDKQWLLENVPVAKSAMEKPALSKNTPIGSKAFEQWLRYVDSNEQPPTPFYSLHACQYLAETRSLIWLAIRNGKYDLTSKERTEVLALLQEEIAEAYKYQNNVLYLCEKKNQSYTDIICQEPIVSVVGYIETIKAIEEKIVEYGIIK